MYIKVGNFDVRRIDDIGLALCKIQAKVFEKTVILVCSEPALIIHIIL